MYYEVTLIDADGNTQYSQVTQDPSWVEEYFKARLSEPRVCNDGPSPHTIEVWKLKRHEEPYYSITIPTNIFNK